MPLLEVAVRRRLVGRLDKGDEVVRTIADAAKRHRVGEAEVRAVGRLAWVEIAGSGPGVRERRDGPFEVVSLGGRVSAADGEVDVTLAIHAIHSAPAVPAAVGRLLAAGAIALDVVVEVWDASAPAAATGPVPTQKEAAWAKVVEASAKRPVRAPRPEPVVPLADLPTSPRRGGEIDYDEPMPEVGDEVQHPQFGRCRVVESADDKISIRLASGRIIQLGASVLKFGAPDEEDGKRVFPVEVRVRR